MATSDSPFSPLDADDAVVVVLLLLLEFSCSVLPAEGAALELVLLAVVVAAAVDGSVVSESSITSESGS